MSETTLNCIDHVRQYMFEMTLNVIDLVDQLDVRNDKKLKNPGK